MTQVIGCGQVITSLFDRGQRNELTFVYSQQINWFVHAVILTHRQASRHGQFKVFSSDQRFAHVFTGGAQLVFLNPLVEFSDQVRAVIQVLGVRQAVGYALLGIFPAVDERSNVWVVCRFESIQ